MARILVEAIGRAGFLYLFSPLGPWRFGQYLQPWCFMWILATAIFFGCKWQSWWHVRTISGATLCRSFGFLFGWPGMDATAFLDPEQHAQRPEAKEWSWAIAKTAFGALLVWGVARRIPAGRELLAGWVAMLGIILVLHFGTFHILSLLWRSAGVDARPIMQAPLSATSLSDFWGRRWNLGFRQLTHRLIFQPARTRSGVVTATLSVDLSLREYPRSCDLVSGARRLRIAKLLFCPARLGCSVRTVNAGEGTGT